MERSTNALAELAERLEDVLAYAQDELFLEHKQTLDKAQRIVAELAKVSDGHWENICDGPPVYICHVEDLKVLCCIGKCRAIAEEGAGDGK